MDIRPLTPTEQKYTYAQSMQLEGQTGTIGHLRGDFATTGYGFYTTWFDTRPQWKSDEFKADLDTVINALREDKGLLHNRYDMSAFARHFPESAIKGNYCTEYGFRVDTEKHAFLLRCNPTKGDYNFYCYCYVKEWLDKHKLFNLRRKIVLLGLTQRRQLFIQSGNAPGHQVFIEFFLCGVRLRVLRCILRIVLTEKPVHINLVRAAGRFSASMVSVTYLLFT